MIYAVLEVVRTKIDVPEEGLQSGTTGTIVEVFTVPNLAYEVDFVDSEGRTIAQCAFLPEYIEPAASASTSNARLETAAT